MTLRTSLEMSIWASSSLVAIGRARRRVFLAGVAALGCVEEEPSLGWRRERIEGRGGVEFARALGRIGCCVLAPPK